MSRIHYTSILLLGILSSCHSGKLQNLLDLPISIKENSALEYTYHDRLMWTIQDAGNPNYLYALDSKGALERVLEVENAENIDWEDLTSDKEENVYIGDFGNNRKDREQFAIYKVSKPGEAKKRVSAETISFTLPSNVPSQDFEAFFLYKGKFYIFSKDDKKGVLLSVENTIGSQVARLVTKFNLKGKDNKITAADISADGKTIVLLNHEKLWKITKFTSDNFFEGNIETLPFDHASQKEGIVFVTNDAVLITDELHDNEGGNLYRFNLKQKNQKKK